MLITEDFTVPAGFFSITNEAAFRLKTPTHCQIMLDCAAVKAESQLNFLLGGLLGFFSLLDPSAVADTLC